MVRMDGGMSLSRALAQDPPADVVDGFVGLQVIDHVGVITLARPEQHNVLSLASWKRIVEAAHELSERPDVQAVILRGAGEKVLGTGADIKEFPTTRMTPAAAADYNEWIAKALRAVADIPKPVIAMIQGLAVGGGLELSATCDLRIAAREARMGIPIGKLGVTLGYTEASALVSLMGASNLKYLLYSSELITAEDALRMGLVQRVVDRDQLIDVVCDLVDKILAASEPTIFAAKKVVDMVGRPMTAADTELLAQITIATYAGADLAEGVAAFSERRSPNFPSRAMISKES